MNAYSLSQLSALARRFLPDYKPGPRRPVPLLLVEVARARDFRAAILRSNRAAR